MQNDLRALGVLQETLLQASFEEYAILELDMSGPGHAYFSLLELAAWKLGSAASIQHSSLELRRPKKSWTTIS